MVYIKENGIETAYSCSKIVIADSKLIFEEVEDEDMNGRIVSFPSVTAIERYRRIKQRQTTLIGLVSGLVLGSGIAWALQDTRTELVNGNVFQTYTQHRWVPTFLAFAGGTAGFLYGKDRASFWESIYTVEKGFFKNEFSNF
jgi:hypothetical protein